MKRRTIGAAALAVALIFSVTGSAVASDHLLDPFTQDELDNNWEPDRAEPTDGVTSVSAFGRSDVARIGIDSNETAPGGFQRTEGIKKTDDFGQEVQVDLYLDPAWEDNAVRAGLWVVGDDGTGDRDELFGIIEFVNSEPCDEANCGGTHPTNRPDHEGFRIWDSTDGGWTEELTTPFQYGDWVTLTITLDTDAGQYSYAIDGEHVGTAGGGTEFIREVFLNSYNYGADEFPNLASDSYAAHWHAGHINSMDQCKDGGWEDAGFKNQGQCIKFVNTGKDSR